MAISLYDLSVPTSCRPSPPWQASSTARPRIARRRVPTLTTSWRRACSQTWRRFTSRSKPPGTTRCGAWRALRTGAFTPPCPGRPGPLRRAAGEHRQGPGGSGGVRSRRDRRLRGKELDLQIGPRRLAFTAETFILSFSLPNYHFHAVTAYDILRSRGVPIGNATTRAGYGPGRRARNLTQFLPTIWLVRAISDGSRTKGDRPRMVGSASCSKASAQEQEGRVKNGITFDTGALIALERRGQRARKVLERATEQKVRIIGAAAVITEWWRSRNDVPRAHPCWGPGGASFGAPCQSGWRSARCHQGRNVHRRDRHGLCGSARRTSSTPGRFRAAPSSPTISERSASSASADCQSVSERSARRSGLGLCRPIQIRRAPNLLRNAGPPRSPRSARHRANETRTTPLHWTP